MVKHRYRGRYAGLLSRRLIALATLGTSRDFCALVYLVLAKHLFGIRGRRGPYRPEPLEPLPELLPAGSKPSP